MAKDAGTKQDAPPSDRQPDAEVQEQPQDEAKQAVAQEQGADQPSADAGRLGAEAEDAPKPKRKRAPKKADGTAAAATDVDKDAAEAGATGAEATTAGVADAGGPAKSTGPKPARRSRAKKADEPAAAPARAERGPAGERVVVRAHAKYVRSSARKARLIADHVRGKDVQQARAILAFSPRSVAEDWRKVLESAIANAEHNHDLVGDDLRVLNATADEGPTLKRYQPRAMGRATRIRKRTSHLTITLTPKE